MKRLAILAVVMLAGCGDRGPSITTEVRELRTRLDAEIARRVEAEASAAEFDAWRDKYANSCNAALEKARKEHK